MFGGDKEGRKEGTIDKEIKLYLLIPLSFLIVMSPGNIYIYFFVRKNRERSNYQIGNNW